MVKIGLLVIVFGIQFVLYCCIVQGKREDELMERLFREKGESNCNDGKEVGCEWENQES